MTVISGSRRDQLVEAASATLANPDSDVIYRSSVFVLVSRVVDAVLAELGIAVDPANEEAKP